MHTLIIGSNNHTHEVEKSKAMLTLGCHFDGFNVLDSVGYYKGAQENSINVTIAGADSSNVDAVASELCRVLEQDSILVWYPNGSYSFITK